MASKKDSSAIIAKLYAILSAFNAGWRFQYTHRPKPGHQHQKEPVNVLEPRLRPPQGDIELMPNQIFSFEPAARLEQVANEQCERMEESNHRR